MFLGSVTLDFVAEHRWLGPVTSVSLGPNRSCSAPSGRSTLRGSLIDDVWFSEKNVGFSCWWQSIWVVCRHTVIGQIGHFELSLYVGIQPYTSKWRRVDARVH